MRPRLLCRSVPADMSRPAWIDGTVESAVRAFNRNPWTNQRLELLPRNGCHALCGGWLVDPPRAHVHRGAGIPASLRACSSCRRLRLRHTLASAHALVGGPAWFDGGRRVSWNAARAEVSWPPRSATTSAGAIGRSICMTPSSPRCQTKLAIEQTGLPLLRLERERRPRRLAEWPGVRLVVGRIPETLGDSPDEIAFLHVDLNHAAAESAAVRHFWPRMPPGAVLVFDDYGFEGFEASREAADALGRVLGFSVLRRLQGRASSSSPCRRRRPGAGPIQSKAPVSLVRPRAVRPRGAGAR